MRTHIGWLTVLAAVLAASTAAVAQRSDLGVGAIGGVSNDFGLGVRGVGSIRHNYGSYVNGYSGFATGGRDVNTGPLTVNRDAGVLATGVTSGSWSRMWGVPGGLSGSLRVNASAGSSSALTSGGGGSMLDSTSNAIPELQYGSSSGSSSLPRPGVSAPVVGVTATAATAATATTPARIVAPPGGALPGSPAGQTFDLAAALKSNSHWQCGADLLKAGRFAEAADAIRVGVIFKPNRAEGEWLLAVAAAGAEDYAEAVFRLRNALTLCPALLTQRRGAAGLLPDAIIQNRAASPAGATTERRLVAAWLAGELGRADAVLVGPAKELSGAALPVAAALDAAGSGGGAGPAADAKSGKG